MRSKFIIFLVVSLLLLADARPAFAKFPNVIEHATGDVRYTFADWPALVIAGGAVAAGAFSSVDHSMQGRFQRRHLGKADTIAKYVGQAYVLDPIALVLFGAGELSHNEKLSVTGETLLESLLFTDAMTGILKLGFDRKRPNGGSYSFPSGHAASTFAIASSLETLYGPIAGIPAFAAASFISITRVDRNEHFVSDVVFGAALGSAIGWGVAHFHKLKNPNLFIAPTVAGGAQGLSLVGRF